MIDAPKPRPRGATAIETEPPHRKRFRNMTFVTIAVLVAVVTLATLIIRQSCPPPATGKRDRQIRDPSVDHLARHTSGLGI